MTTPVQSQIGWPFVRREWAQQLRRKRQGRQGAYPGLFWASTALSLPLLQLGFSAYGVELLPDRLWSYRCAGIWLVWLTCLRACMGCAVSMAEEVQSHSVGLVRHLPRSGGVLGMLATKSLVTTAPLLFEWGLFLGLSGLLSLAGLDVEAAAPLRFLAVGLCSMVFFCCLGLWIGARLAEPERAAGNARVAVVMTLVGWALLESVLQPAILVIGALMWVALIFRSSPRVASAFQSGVVFAVLVLLLPQLYLIGNVKLAQLSPLAAVQSPALASTNSLLYCLGALLILGMNYRQLRRS